MYVVVDTATGQWLTCPIPREDALFLARVHSDRHVEWVD